MRYKHFFSVHRTVENQALEMPLKNRNETQTLVESDD